jgi:tetratricopeptide (TPR) repeat protein
MNLLVTLGRIDDAILILQTCQKLDPYNGQIVELISELKRIKSGGSASDQINGIFKLIQEDMAQHRTNEAEKMLDQLLAFAGADVNTMMGVAQEYAMLQNFPKSEQAIKRITQLAPDHPDGWYNLAIIQFAQGETSNMLASLKTALDLNAKELAKNPKAPDYRKILFQDSNMAGVRQTPEFKAAFGDKP